MKHKFIIKYKANVIDGYTFVSKHRRASDAIESAWSFVKNTHDDSRHLVVFVFSGDVCVYKIVRSENGGFGKHSKRYSYKYDYGDLSREDAHYAVFEDDDGHIKPLMDYGNNMDSAVRSVDLGKRRVLGFFTDKRRRFAFLWCTLLIFAMVLFALLCLTMAVTARNGLDQLISVLAVITSFIVVYEVIKYVNEYWRSCSYVNFDVMNNADHFIKMHTG